MMPSEYYIMHLEFIRDVFNEEPTLVKALRIGLDWREVYCCALGWDINDLKEAPSSLFAAMRTLKKGGIIIKASSIPKGDPLTVLRECLMLSLRLSKSFYPYGKEKVHDAAYINVLYYAAPYLCNDPEKLQQVLLGAPPTAQVVGEHLDYFESVFGEKL